MIEEKFVGEIGRAVGAKREQVAGAVALLDKGATDCFIARYRKDATGNLGEERLADIGALNGRFIALTNRRDAILANIEKQGKLSDDLRAKISGCMDHAVLEELYLPFKKGYRTKGSVALERGLGGLADLIWEQTKDLSALEVDAAAFVDSEKMVESVKDAMEGACAILAERIGRDVGARSLVRKRMLDGGKVVTVGTKNAEGQKTRFESYYKFSAPLKRIGGYDLLMAMKGVRQGFLRLDVAVDDEATLGALEKKYLKEGAEPLGGAMKEVIGDAFGRLLRPKVEETLLEEARLRAEGEIVGELRGSAFALLMTPPAGEVVVLGVSPTSEGCSVAVVDAAGGFVAEGSLSVEGEGAGESAAKLVALVQEHGVRYIAVGHGGGPRAVSNFIRDALTEKAVNDVPVVIVNSAGAGAYGTSAVGVAALPDSGTAVREAVFVGRRLQNPLKALVSLEPRYFGLGPSQHIVNQRHLQEVIHGVIETCVSRVGVDVNTAPAELLRYVSGIQLGTAQNIVAYRTEHGPFTSREQLRAVAGIGDKIYVQCVGFLRVAGGENPLYATGIHPESFGLVGKIAAACAVTVEALLGNRALLRELKHSAFAEDGLGELGFGEIRRELTSPGVDPRGGFRVAKFRDGLSAVDALKEGDELEGVVTNVTDFGAFLDVGLPQDGLIHLSEMANRFVRDPRTVLRIGQIVRVRVKKIEAETMRLSFSMKLTPKGGGSRGPEKKREAGAAGDGSRSSREGRPKAAGTNVRGSEKKFVRKPKRSSKEKDGGKRKGSTVSTFGSNEAFGGSMAEQLKDIKERLG